MAKKTTPAKSPAKAAKTSGTAAPSAIAPPVGAWPADSVERRAVADLVPYARNARKHSPKQIAQLVESIKRWGFTIPILIDETDMIIAGHGRVMAANEMGLLEVPVMVARGWTEEQRKAYVLADNQLAANSSWDSGLLALELGDLKAAEFDIGALGFSKSEVRRSLDSLQVSTASAAQLGDDLTFRIVIDCTSEEHQAELLARLEEEGLTCRPLIS